MIVRDRLVVVALLLVLGACGGSGGGGSSSGSVSTGGGSTTSGAGGSGGASGGSGGSTTGGSAFEFETGVGGSGGIIGEIDDFGSIIINGLEMNTDNAAFFVEGESGRVQGDLRVGQYVVIAGDLNRLDADSVHYRANLRGPVSTPPVVLDPDTGRYELVVVGQTVLTGASTRFDGALAEEIRQGDLLEVSGPTDSDGRVRATYIARLSVLDEYKAVGRVADLDTAAQTFDLGGLQVSYSAADFLRFAEPALRAGQLVEVRMAPAGFTEPATASADEVERLPVPTLGEGAEVEVEGPIDTFVSPTEFSVSGIPVTTTASTEFENGTLDQLGLNAEVEVEGRTNAAGILVAEEIEFEQRRAIRVEGPVSEVNVSTGTVTALGVPFEVRDGTRLEDRRDDLDPFTLNDLMPGDVVRARGFLEGTRVVAVEVERSSPNPGNERTLLRGPVTGFDKAAATVAVQNVNIVDGIGATDYRDEDGDAVDRDPFYDLLLPDARELNVIWDDFGSLADPADRLTIEDDD
ncbi:MAG: DUF5666 domain-containing protein [Pseudomonadales bacterium]